jgi:diamine N-acetyltransferase
MKRKKTAFARRKFTLDGFALLPLARADALPIARKICAIEPWSRIRYRPAKLARHLRASEPSFRSYKIMVDGKIAGLVSIRFPWLHGTYLDLLAVFPGRQGREIGKGIIRWMESETAARYKNLWALVSDFNTGARKFYKKQGFNEIAVIADLVKPGFDEILIRKTLD